MNDRIQTLGLPDVVIWNPLGNARLDILQDGTVQSEAVIANLGISPLTELVDRAECEQREQQPALRSRQGWHLVHQDDTRHATEGEWHRVTGFQCIDQRATRDQWMDAIHRHPHAGDSLAESGHPGPIPAPNIFDIKGLSKTSQGARSTLAPAMLRRRVQHRKNPSARTRLTLRVQ